MLSCTKIEINDDVEEYSFNEVICTNQIAVKQDLFEDSVYECNSPAQNESPNFDFMNEGSSGQHPYLGEIESFVPLQSQISITECPLPKSLEDTPFYFINKTFDLIKLAKNLKKENEIAVNLHWDSTKFSGVVNVLVISTKHADFIIDTITLKHDMMILADTFSNPGIVKIFSGSHEKLAYLQSLHLFVVNIFDLKHAFNELNDPLFFNTYISMNYQYLRSSLIRDIYGGRPLTESQQEYLRSSTHFLIHMYHVVKNRIIASEDQFLITNFLDNMRNTCKILYEDLNDIYFSKITKQLSSRHKIEFEALKELQNWRKKLGQTFNKNLKSILKDSLMLELAHELPVDADTILNITENNHYVSIDIQEIVNIFNNLTSSFKRNTANSINQASSNEAIPDSIAPEEQSSQPQTNSQQATRSSKKNRMVQNQPQNSNQRSKKSKQSAQKLRSASSKRSRNNGEQGADCGNATRKRKRKNKNKSQNQDYNYYTQKNQPHYSQNYVYKDAEQNYNNYN